jgi:alpha-tubulin suppressor-like RCC1 family protein
LTFTTLSGTCGLVAGGAAYCWGSNGDGGLGVSNTTETCIYNTPCSTTPVAVEGGHTFVALVGTCGVTADGTAYCWGPIGGGSIPQQVGGALRFAAISPGYDYACGLTTDGVVYCWGQNYNGQLGNGTHVESLVPVKVAGQP